MADEGSKAAGGTSPRQPKLRYQDRVDIDEVFADSIRSCVFDGQVARIEFTVSRLDDPGLLGVLEGRQVPVARLVLNRTALTDLFSRLNQLQAMGQNAKPAAEPAAIPATSSQPVRPASSMIPPWNARG
jgi:hypothetical protein